VVLIHLLLFYHSLKYDTNILTTGQQTSKRVSFFRSLALASPYGQTRSTSGKRLRRSTRPSPKPLRAVPFYCRLCSDCESVQNSRPLLCRYEFTKVHEFGSHQSPVRPNAYHNSIRSSGKAQLISTLCLSLCFTPQSSLQNLTHFILIENETPTMLQTKAFKYLVGKAASNIQIIIPNTCECDGHETPCLDIVEFPETCFACYKEISMVCGECMIICGTCDEVFCRDCAKTIILECDVCGTRGESYVSDRGSRV
jgi:hypothetical protein